MGKGIGVGAGKTASVPSMNSVLWLLAVVMDVVPAAVHPETVVVEQAVWVIVATVKLPVVPVINDVENDTVFVHKGTAVLPVHEEEDEEDDDDDD